MAGKKKYKSKDSPSRTKVDITDADLGGDQYVIPTKELETRLDAANSKITELAMYGKTPDLLKMSWENYELFKKGLLPKYFGDDEAQLQEFYNDKRKEFVLKLVTFIDVASNHLVDDNKLKEASLKEISSSIKLALDMVSSLVGIEQSTVVKHEHTVDIASLSEAQIGDKIKEAKETLSAVEAEFTSKDDSKDEDPTSF